MIPNGEVDGNSPQKLTFFVDIDNCLYPKSYKIHEIMGELINDFFQKHLSMTREDAHELHLRYYKDYGLAIEGLVRHHDVDPMIYNNQVDDALALDEIIKPSPSLRRLLEDIDRSRVRLWLFTNAHITHGERVVKLLGVEDLFDGITYCDYAEKRLLSKPAEAMFDKAMRESGAGRRDDCYYVDDSALNAAAGQQYGWKTAHLVEPVSDPPPMPVSAHQIQELEELRQIFPELFKSAKT